jgi:FkbM family methyltransferase
MPLGKATREKATMNVQRIVTRMAQCVPRTVKIALRGKRSAPSRFANAVHSLLNRVPGEKYRVLSCSGVLKGYKMRIDWTKHRSFAYGTWEPEVVDSIRENVLPGMTVMDIGAHAGFYALLFAKLVGPAGQVIAFEPLPANFRLLEENIALNGLRNVLVRHEAVGERSGKLNLEVPDLEDHLLAGPMSSADPRGSMTVPVVSLDDFILQRGLHIDFIKMDVEGAEGSILRGAQETLRASHPAMVVELHNAERQAGRHPVAAYMEGLGYQVQGLSEVGYTTHTFMQWPANVARA